MLFWDPSDRIPAAAAIFSALFFSVFPGCSSKTHSATEPTDSHDSSEATDTEELDTGTSLDEACPAHPAPAVCDAVTPAPTDPAEIRDFAVKNAVPLSCDTLTRWIWDFVIDSAKNSRVIAMGEVHGSREIGPASAALFTQLVKEGSVDTLALEMGMDLDEALESRISGDSTSLDAYGARAWADVMFWRTLPDAARALREDGFGLRVFGVDVPWAVEPMVEKLRGLAGRQAPEVEDALLDGLPSGVPFGEDVGPDVLAAACDYSARIQKELGALCEDLEDIVCLDILRFASGVCFAAQINAPSFWDDASLDMNRWLAEREKLIYANYLAIFAVHPEAKVYAHMGGFHAGQSGGSVGQMLAKELRRHGERLFSLWPAYGDGSAVLVDGAETPLEAQPPILHGAIERLTVGPHYLPIRAPGFDCAANPFFERENPELGGTYGDGFDGFVIFPRLTPERSPGRSSSHLDKGFAIRKKIAALDALSARTLRH